MQIFKNKGSCDGYLPQDALAFSLVTIAHTANLMTLTKMVSPLLRRYAVEKELPFFENSSEDVFASAVFIASVAVFFGGKFISVGDPLAQ